MENFYAALEIGTTRTVLAIAEPAASGRLAITCRRAIPSTGIRKSQILSIPDATQSIRAVLQEIEKAQDQKGASVTIGNAVLAVSGQGVQATHSEGQAVVEGRKVGAEEINEVARRVREFPLPKNRELIDLVEQDYVLDTLGGILSPKGMAGKLLKLNALHIHADADRIQDARTAAEGAHLEISEPLFATTCAAEAVLEEDEKKNGVLVLDLGGGSTGYAVYENGFLVHTGVLGVGGDHVTNDIAHAFQTTNAQAEALKTTEASAVPRDCSAIGTRVRVPGSSALMESRTISRRALDTVVNARVKETFSILREMLESQGLLSRLHAGVVLTGGGAGLVGIEELAEQELALGVRRGRPLLVDGLEDDPQPWACATIAGALLYAQANDDSTSLFGGLFGRFFK